MKDSCPTKQYIQSIAKAAAGMGESACEVLIGGVRVTVHVPFEGPLKREVAQSALGHGALEVQSGALAMRASQAPKPQRMNVLIIGWIAESGQSIHPPIFHSLN